MPTKTPSQILALRPGDRIIPTHSMDVLPLPFAGTLGNIEQEVVAGAIVACCRDAGDDWGKVPAQAFFAKLQEINGQETWWPIYFAPQGNVLGQMEEEGLIIIDRTVNPQTIRATDKLAEKLRKY